MMNLFRRARAELLLQIGYRGSQSQCLSFVKPPANPQAVAAERLAALLVHARQKVPYYRDIIPAGRDGRSARDWLSSVPLLTKDDVEANFPDAITDDSDPTDWRMMATRGTAQRLITVQDFSKRDSIRGSQLRQLRISGYRPGKRKVEIPPEVCEIVCGDEGETEQSVLAHIRGSIRNGQWRDPKSIRDLRGLIERQWIYNTEIYAGFGRYGTKPPDAVLQKYVDRLRADRPFALKTLATYLVEIAKFIRDTEQPCLKIPVVKAMGSRVTPNQRGLIEQSFGGTFWDDYGSAEFGTIACDCKRHNGLHVFDDLFVVEVVDDKGNPVADGERGWILITDLMNRAMPLIRYQIGDVGFLDTRPCPCGQSGIRLTVEGRAHDVLVTNSGWRTHDDVVDFCEAFPGVDSCVVECRPNDRYSLTVVPERHVEFQKEDFIAAFSKWLGTRARVSVRIATTIAAEAGGKFRFVRGNLIKARNAA